MSSEADGRAPADARTRWIARLGSALLGLLARTWRFRVIGREPVNALRRAGRPVAFAFWHGQMLPLVVQHRNEGVAILVSSHRDGEIIARIIHRFGFRTVRGSSSRGAGRALLGLVRELQAGREIAVTPDGPRGPARRFARRARRGPARRRARDPGERARGTCLAPPLLGRVHDPQAVHARDGGVRPADASVGDQRPGRGGGVGPVRGAARRDRGDRTPWLTSRT
jgi:hypothetical protein